MTRTLPETDGASIEACVDGCPYRSPANQRYRTDVLKNEASPVRRAASAQRSAAGWAGDEGVLLATW